MPRCFIPVSFLRTFFLPTLAMPIKADPNKSKATGSEVTTMISVKPPTVAETLFAIRIKPANINDKIT
jgi:hypothetical protein